LNIGFGGTVIFFFTLKTLFVLLKIVFLSVKLILPVAKVLTGLVDQLVTTA
jgi:hypothetical protein